MPLIEVCTSEDVARILGVSDTTARKYIDDGKIPTLLRTGRNTRIVLTLDVYKFAAALAQARADAAEQAIRSETDAITGEAHAS